MTSQFYWVGELENLVHPFDDVACRRETSHKKDLEMMLPKLQGLVGDYVFDGLSYVEYSSYKVLIKHLKYPLYKVETAKTYATMFWRWTRKPLGLKKHMQ